MAETQNVLAGSHLFFLPHFRALCCLCLGEVKVTRWQEESRDPNVSLSDSEACYGQFTAQPPKVQVNSYSNLLKSLCMCVLSLSVMFYSWQPHGLCSPPGFSSHGSFQVKILEWVSISYSRGSSQPRDQTHVSCKGKQIFYHCTTWENLEGQ